MRNVIVFDRLRIHWSPKVAHQAINQALGYQHVETAYPDEPGPQKRFMAIRHPLDRLVSAWAFFLDGKTEADNNELILLGYRPGCTFDEFLDRVLVDYDDDIHTAPQSRNAGPFPIDYAVKFEDLPAAWAWLREAYPETQLGPLLVRNASRHAPWTAYYNVTTRAKAEQVFANDLKLWENARFTPAPRLPFLGD